MFREIGTPSGLGLRRDKRGRECLNSSVNTQFRDDLSVDLTEDQMMRICCNWSYKIDFSISRLHDIFKALIIMVSKGLSNCKVLILLMVFL